MFDFEFKEGFIVLLGVVIIGFINILVIVLVEFEVVNYFVLLEREKISFILLLKYFIYYIFLKLKIIKKSDIGLDFS